MYPNYIHHCSTTFLLTTLLSFCIYSILFHFTFLFYIDITFSVINTNKQEHLRKAAQLELVVRWCRIPQVTTVKLITSTTPCYSNQLPENVWETPFPLFAPLSLCLSIVSVPDLCFQHQHQHQHQHRHRRPHPVIVMVHVSLPGGGCRHSMVSLVVLEQWRRSLSRKCRYSINHNETKKKAKKRGD